VEHPWYSIPHFLELGVPPSWMLVRKKELARFCTGTYASMRLAYTPDPLPTCPIGSRQGSAVLIRCGLVICNTRPTSGTKPPRLEARRFKRAARDTFARFELESPWQCRPNCRWALSYLSLPASTAPFCSGEVLVLLTHARGRRRGHLQSSATF
jgi:hypothetical protein